MPDLLSELPTRMHHHAFVVRDQETTRHFYEDVLGIPLVATWCEVEDVRGKRREYCHTFFGLGDGSALAFFQFVDPADFEELGARRPTTLDHIALKVTPSTQDELIKRIDAAGMRHRLINHGYCRSLYVTDPDGLGVEFTADTDDLHDINRIRLADAHAELKRWMAGDRSSNNAWRLEAH